MARAVKVDISSNISPSDLITTLEADAAASTAAAASAAESQTAAAKSETNAAASESAAVASAAAALTSENAAKSSEENARSAAQTAAEDAIANLDNGILQLLHLWEKETIVIVGQIAYSTNLPGWARLECVAGGKTALLEPTWGTTAAVLVADGTATWIIDDVRDGGLAGDISYKMYLKTGHVKANGATVNRADYPRLFKLAVDNKLFYDDGTRLFVGTTAVSSTTISGISTADIAKLTIGMLISGTGITAGTTIKTISTASITISIAATVAGTGVSISYGNATNFLGLFGSGDGSTTFVLPNGIDRVIQGGDTAGKAIAAGLPNITGRYADQGFDTAASGTGAMYNAGGLINGTHHGNIQSGYTSVGFDASRSNAIYGASTTVQPSAITMIPQIKY